MTELELGIGDDDAAGEGVLGALLIQGDGVVAQLGGVLLAVAGELLFQHIDALLVGDILVVIADLGLGGGCLLYTSYILKKLYLHFGILMFSLSELQILLCRILHLHDHSSHGFGQLHILTVRCV